MIDLFNEMAERERRSAERFADKIVLWCVYIGATIVLLEYAVR